MVRVAIAQINYCVGDLEGNSRKMIQAISKAKASDVELIIFTELSVTGYPPQDLLLERDFLEKNKGKLEEIVNETADIAAIVGFVEYQWPLDQKYPTLFNAAAIIQNKKVVKTVYKSLLPTYDVFDEERYFTPATSNDVTELEFSGHTCRLGVEICEDLWDKTYQT